MLNLMFTMLYMVETTERDSLRHILVPAPSGADAVQNVPDILSNRGGSHPSN